MSSFPKEADAQINCLKSPAPWKHLALWRVGFGLHLAEPRRKDGRNRPVGQGRAGEREYEWGRCSMVRSGRGTRGSVWARSCRQRQQRM